MKSVRWGILGAGKIAHSFVKDFPLLENAELVAVASSSAERAARFAAETNIPQALSYNELYNSRDIDAVYIATTHNFHYDQILQSLLHGKHVLSEKPITVNDEQFSHLAQVAAEQQVFLMEAVWTYFLPAIKKAKEWVDEKRLGEIRLLQSDFGFVVEKKLAGRMYNPKLAGGALLDLGIYPVSAAYYFLGQLPKTIKASATFTETGVDETVAIILQYENLLATLSASLISHPLNSTRIYGEKGYIEIPTFWKATTATLYDRDGNLLESYDDGRTSHGFIYEMQHANEKILAGELQSDIIPHSRSLAIQQTLTEVRRQIGFKYPFE